MNVSPEHYVTLFDSNFLPQGLALHSSLRAHQPNFVLWALCMDELSHQVLTTLDLPAMRPIALSEVETPELLEVKGERTRAEYCWTVTPLTPKLVFERDDSAHRVTYVDADLFFLASPATIFREFEESKKAILITEHDYDPIYDRSRTHGRFCVQFMTFVRDESEEVRAWWQARCEEWCYARVEDGKFGDQRYLDDWPDRFGEKVHVLGAKGSILAPWNARKHAIGGAIAWHFHGLRLLGKGRVLLYSSYHIPEVVEKHVYMPYLAVLREQLHVMGRDMVQARMSALGFWWRLLTGGIRSLAIRLARYVLERPGKVARL